MAIEDIGKVLNFWFEELSPADWWKKNKELDGVIRSRFEKIHFLATKGELFRWREAADGRLAEIIILDQFSRNIFRDEVRAFAFDGMALVLAQECVALGLDQSLNINKRRFIYMPYMHSESLLVHDEAVKLFGQEGLHENLKFEHAHRDIIKKFGRYPHRNEVLGRVSSEEEKEFLKGPNSSF